MCRTLQYNKNKIIRQMDYFHYIFQAAFIVIASLAQARRSNLLKLFLNEPQGEFKNNFRVAYPKKRQCKNNFRLPEK